MPHVQKAASDRGRPAGKIPKVQHDLEPKRGPWRATQFRHRSQERGLEGVFGNAPDQPFDVYRFRSSGGGEGGGGGGIFTTDGALAGHDARAVGPGAPGGGLQASGVQFLWTGQWETPDTVQTLMRYPEGSCRSTRGHVRQHRNRAMTVIMGSDATLYIDRGRYELHPENGKGPYEELILVDKTRGRGADFYTTPDAERLLLQNGWTGMRTRNKPATPAEAGVGSAAGAHLANLALAQRTGRPVEVSGRSPLNSREFPRKDTVKASLMGGRGS